MSFLILFLFLPILIESTGINQYYYESWCDPSGLEYLDDSKCVKQFPSNMKNDWNCDIIYDDFSDLPVGYMPDKPFTQIEVDITSLNNIVTTDANVCIINTKRVKAKNNGIWDGTSVDLYNKYYCVGSYSRDTAFETWSSSKIIAIANAASTLRGRENSSSCPLGSIGLDTFTTGKDGDILLGDLATIVCSYDETAGYSSNSLASYFHDIGWRVRIHDLIQSDWLANSTTISLGGNYGEATPSDLSFNIHYSSSDPIDKSDNICPVQKDPNTEVYENSLTALAAAELTRRLVLHSDLDPSLRFPYMLSSDSLEIRQGVKYSDDELTSDSIVKSKFPMQFFGGMSADTAVFLQSSINISDVEIASNGSWRIFSKLGAGYSTSRSKGEIVTNAYGCFPSYGKEKGIEMTFSVRGSVDYDTSLTLAQEVVLKSVQELMQAVVSGEIV